MELFFYFHFLQWLIMVLVLHLTGTIEIKTVIKDLIFSFLLLTNTGASTSPVSSGSERSSTSSVPAASPPQLVPWLPRSPMLAANFPLAMCTSPRLSGASAIEEAATQIIIHALRTSKSVQPFRWVVVEIVDDVVIIV